MISGWKAERSAPRSKRLGSHSAWPGGAAAYWHTCRYSHALGSMTGWPRLSPRCVRASRCCVMWRGACSRGCRGCTARLFSSPLFSRVPVAVRVCLSCVCVCLRLYAMYQEAWQRTRGGSGVACCVESAPSVGTRCSQWNSACYPLPFFRAGTRLRLLLHGFPRLRTHACVPEPAHGSRKNRTQQGRDREEQT